MLVNLVANAADAMPDGGTLTVRASSNPGNPGEVAVGVLDTGTGMSAETLDRIFEPFFTTKAPGKGTGLGLPSLRAMVQEDGGRIEVSSELGAGTRVRILLPRVG
jgi:signal transduction histidine kinase